MSKKKKTCFDCFHCKVSAKSTEKCQLCYCSQTKARARHKEAYWLAKPVCKRFDDDGLKQR